MKKTSYDHLMQAVSQDFYTSIAERYPHSWIPFIFYIISGPRHAIEQDYTITPYQVVADLLSIGPWQRKTFSAIETLEQFGMEVEPIEILGYSKDHKLSRAIKVKWPPEVLNMIKDELLQNREDMESFVDVIDLTAPSFVLEQIYNDFIRISQRGMVYWSGEPCNLLDTKTYIKLKYKEVNKIIRKNKLIRRNGDISGQMISYLNSLPEALFLDAVKEHFKEASIYLFKSYQDHKIKKAQFNSNIISLQQVSDYCKPIVQPTENSSRVFPYGYSLMNIPSEIRKILTQDWTELDLKSCQFTIVGKLWNIPSILLLLEQGTHIWKHIAKEMNVEYTDEIKKQIKTAVYSIIFGGTLRQLDHVFENEQLKSSFLSVKIISDLKRGATKELKKIRKNGKATNAMGQIIQLHKVKVQDGKSPERSLLAQVVQSFETMMLKPAFDLAIEQRHEETGFFLPLYQYDGISIVAKQSDQQEYWVDKVTKAVNTKIKDMGFKTELLKAN